MKHRNPLAVVIFSMITFGIYALVWSVKTKNEMNARGASIPTAWLLIIPFVSIWWLWKYSEGVEKTTGGKLSAVLSFILLFLLSVVGMAIVQNEFNKVGTVAEAAGPATEAITQTPTNVTAASNPQVVSQVPSQAPPQSDNETPPNNIITPHV